MRTRTQQERDPDATMRTRTWQEWDPDATMRTRTWQERNPNANMRVRHVLGGSRTVELVGNCSTALDLLA